MSIALCCWLKECVCLCKNWKFMLLRCCYKVLSTPASQEYNESTRERNRKRGEKKELPLLKTKTNVAKIYIETNANELAQKEETRIEMKLVKKDETKWPFQHLISCCHETFFISLYQCFSFFSFASFVCVHFLLIVR